MCGEWETLKHSVLNGMSSKFFPQDSGIYAEETIDGSKETPSFRHNRTDARMNLHMNPQRLKQAAQVQTRQVPALRRGSGHKISPLPITKKLFAIVTC